MLNIDKFRTELQNMNMFEGCLFAVVDGKPHVCEKTACHLCEFNDYGYLCERNIIRWLLSEYRGRRKLTKKQHLFLRFLENGFLVRDEKNRLTWYQYEPKREEHAWTASLFKKDDDLMVIPEHVIDFPFIGWTSKPFPVREMLKWEVKED